jgi:hypothetical protein
VAYFAFASPQPILEPVFAPARRFESVENRRAERH